MRTLRLSLVGTVTLVLTGGLTTSLAAQDPEAATWTHVTGSTVEGEWTEDTTPARWEGSVEFWPTRSQTLTVDWSDPRLPEAMHMQQDVVVHHGDLTSYDDYMALWANAVRLEGMDGTWTGWERGLDGSDGAWNLMVLTGEGAYEGLSAVFEYELDDESSVTRYDGFIFESELPAVPARVEVAEE